MSIYHNLEYIKRIAKAQSERHNINYNVVILNPNSKGEFDAGYGSTYEIVSDNYFDEKRPDAKLICRTDEMK